MNIYYKIAIYNVIPLCVKYHKKIKKETFQNVFPKGQPLNKGISR